MRVLALDTSRTAGSLALVEDGSIVAERIGDARRSHAERLPADLLALLSASGRSPADVDLFAIAAGPGSFTGLRIGIATMQGLAFVEQKPMVPVSVLEALAQWAARDHPAGAIVGAWVDAHRREVFSALYRLSEGPPFSVGRLQELDAPAVGSPAARARMWAEQPGEIAAIAGDGAVLYADTLGSHGLDRVEITEPAALAGVIGLMATCRADHAVGPAGVQPLYIRRPDAEVARDGAHSSPWLRGTSGR